MQPLSGLHQWKDFQKRLVEHLALNKSDIHLRNIIVICTKFIHILTDRLRDFKVYNTYQYRADNSQGSLKVT